MQSDYPRLAPAPPDVQVDALIGQLMEAAVNVSRARTGDPAAREALKQWIPVDGEQLCFGSVALIQHLLDDPTIEVVGVDMEDA